MKTENVALNNPSRGAAVSQKHDNTDFYSSIRDVLGVDSESHNTVLLSVQPRLCTLIFISFYQAVFGEDNLCASAAAQKQVIPVITPHSGGSSVGLWSYK